MTAAAARHGRKVGNATPVTFPSDSRSLFGFPNVTQHSVVTLRLRQLCSSKPGVAGSSPAGPVEYQFDRHWPLMGPSFFRQSNPKIGAWIVWQS